MMRYIVALLGALLIGWGAYTPPAQAQMMCGDRNEAVITLEREYSEMPVAMGLTANGNVVEVFASESGTFTIIVTRPNGVSCVMLTGEDWEDFQAKMAGS